VVQKKGKEALLAALGRAVRRRREELEFSQEDLGFESDLDRTYISGIERGVRNPSYTVLFPLSKALDLSVSELLLRVEKERGRRV